MVEEQITKDFRRAEFASPDTGECWIDEAFVQGLQVARDLAGVPFRITSGCRTPAHNQAVGGTPNSAHLRGKAADIAAPDSMARYRVLSALFAAGFKRIGVGSTFIHVDCDETLPQESVWTY